MKIMILILAIALFSNHVMAAWGGATLLQPNGNTIRHYSAVVDDAGITHAAYCLEFVDSAGSVTQGLRYTKSDKSNVLLQTIDIPISSGCRVVKLIGDGSANGLIMAFEGQRRLHLGVCNSTNPSGCYDIYLSLSFNSGEQWSSPIPVDRSSSKDIVERLAPNFALNKVTGRIYLFYTQRPITESVPKLAYVNKPRGSTTFGTEKVLPYLVGSRLIDAAFTIRKDESFIHAFIEDSEGTHAVSSENGMEWSITPFADPSYRLTKFVVSGTDQESMLVATLTDGQRTSIAYTTDHAHSWSTLDLVDKYHKTATITLKWKSAGKYELAVMITSFMSKDQLYAIIELPSGNKVTPQPPFTTIPNYGIFLPQLMPYTGNTQYAYRAFGNIWVNGTNPGVYVSDYSY